MVDLKLYTHHGIYAKYGLTRYLQLSLEGISNRDHVYIDSLEEALRDTLGVFGEEFVWPPKARWISEIKYNSHVQRYYFKEDDIELVSSVIIEHKLMFGA